MQDGLPIVLIPGVLGTSRLFGEQIHALWKFGPVTIADHRRFADIDIAAQSILDSAPPRFALIGLSYGGYLAFAMLQKAPERIERLALLDTQARADNEEAKAGRKHLITMVEDGRLDDAVELLMPRLLSAESLKSDGLNVMIHEMARDAGPQAFILQQRAIMERPDSRSILSNIKCPTLVLVGQADALTPPILSHEMVEAIPNARLAVIPNCGHLSTIERPNEVNAELVAWLCRPS